MDVVGSCNDHGLLVLILEFTSYYLHYLYMFHYLYIHMVAPDRGEEEVGMLLQFLTRVRPRTKY